jgi:hypothetical protein
MNVTEKFSERWMYSLERRRSRMPYSIVWCLLALGGTFIFFGFVDKVWPYYLEGTLVISVAAILFVLEMCCRRIAELKFYLNEYRDAEHNHSAEPTDPFDEVSEMEPQVWTMVDEAETEG